MNMRPHSLWALLLKIMFVHLLTRTSRKFQVALIIYQPQNTHHRSWIVLFFSLCQDSHFQSPLVKRVKMSTWALDHLWQIWICLRQNDTPQTHCNVSSSVYSIGRRMYIIKFLQRTMDMSHYVKHPWKCAQYAVVVVAVHQYHLSIRPWS